jgi:hypothetical protein
MELTTDSAHNCVVLRDRSIACWGANWASQLGNGTTNDGLVPIAVPGLVDAAGVSPGGNHTCAVLASGSAWCWGDNEWGQLGNGTLIQSGVPARVFGL